VEGGETEEKETEAEQLSRAVRRETRIHEQRAAWLAALTRRRQNALAAAGLQKWCAGQMREKSVRWTAATIMRRWQRLTCLKSFRTWSLAVSTYYLVPTAEYDRRAQVLRRLMLKLAPTIMPPSADTSLAVKGLAFRVWCDQLSCQKRRRLKGVKVARRWMLLRAATAWDCWCECVEEERRRCDEQPGGGVRGGALEGGGRRAGVEAEEQRRYQWMHCCRELADVCAAARLLLLQLPAAAHGPASPSTASTPSAAPSADGAASRLTTKRVPPLPIAKALSLPTCSPLQDARPAPSSMSPDPSAPLAAPDWALSSPRAAEPPGRVRLAARQVGTQRAAGEPLVTAAPDEEGAEEDRVQPLRRRPPFPHHLPEPWQDNSMANSLQPQQLLRSEGSPGVSAPQDPWFGDNDATAPSESPEREEGRQGAWEPAAGASSLLPPGSISVRSIDQGHALRAVEGQARSGRVHDESPSSSHTNSVETRALVCVRIRVCVYVCVCVCVCLCVFV